MMNFIDIVCNKRIFNSHINSRHYHKCGKIVSTRYGKDCHLSLFTVLYDDCSTEDYYVHERYKFNDPP